MGVLGLLSGQPRCVGCHCEEDAGNEAREKDGGGWTIGWGGGYLQGLQDALGKQGIKGACGRTGEWRWPRADGDENELAVVYGVDWSEWIVQGWMDVMVMEMRAAEGPCCGVQGHAGYSGDFVVVYQ